MRALVWCSGVAALLLTASSSMAFSVTLKGGPNGGLLGLNEGSSSTINLPAAGGTFEISVALDGPPSAASGLRGAQMQFTANTSGATLNGASGGVARTNAGTRFNGPQPNGPWDADGSCSTPSTAALTSVAGGFYACGYDSNGANNWNTTRTLMGWLNLTVGATASTRTIVISSVIVKGTDQDFTDVVGSPGTISVTQTVPEPASVLLLLGTLPFLRRRRMA